MKKRIEDDRIVVLGVLFSTVSFIIPFVGFIFAIFGIIIGHYYFSKKISKNLALLACVLGYFSLILSVILSALIFIFLQQFL